jgi:hypothetical protein
MMALSPSHWLTASATYAIDDDDSLLSILAVFDNGKTDRGFVNSACTSIHWGPEQPTDAPGAPEPARYVWASPCNESDATQTGWSIESFPSGSYVMVKYSIKKEHGASFTGCLDRSGGWLRVSECTGLVTQRFVKIPTSTGICSSLREGTNCGGYDLDVKQNVETAQECCNFCSRVKGCSAWTWNGQTHAAGEKSCYAKSACPQPKVAQMQTSGFAPVAAFVLAAQDNLHLCVDINEHSATTCKVLADTSAVGGVPTKLHPTRIALGKEGRSCSDECNTDNECVAWALHARQSGVSYCWLYSSYTAEQQQIDPNGAFTFGTRCSNTVGPVR